MFLFVRLGLRELKVLSVDRPTEDDLDEEVEEVERLEDVDKDVDFRLLELRFAVDLRLFEPWDLELELVARG